MIEWGGGQIVVVGSIAGRYGAPYLTTYSATKHALYGFYESLRYEVEQHGVSVLMVTPGFIKTDINKDAWSDDAKVKDALTKIPYCRLGEPEDVANAVVWLSSDQADYITGTTLYIDGGMTLYPSFQEGG